MIRRKRQTTELDPSIRETMEYAEGDQAYRDGTDESECPYPIGNPKRVGWYSGYYTASIGIRFAEIFTRWNIAWP